MKYLTRNLMITVLIVTFVFSAFSGVLLPIIKAIKESDTPIAKISDEMYRANSSNKENYPDKFRKGIESLGGYIYNEEDSNNDIQTSALDYAFQSVKQVITVMTTATGSKEHGNYVESKPLANAIVRLNGVPRYTDRNGQVRATLDREYVELFVEKNGYGPYIEIMEVTGEDKTVYLKKESDDIDLFGVLLKDIESDPVNLINSDYTIFPDALGDYIANMEFLVNVKADDYMLLLEDEVIYSSDENIIYDIDFTDDMEGKKFYAQVEYQEILSEPVALNLCVSIPDFYKEESDIELYDDSEGTVNSLNPFAGKDEHNFFGGLKVDLDIAKLANINRLLNAENKVIDFNLIIDGRKGVVFLTIGFDRNKEIAIGDKDKQDYRETKEKIKGYKQQKKQPREERKEKQKEINTAKKEYREKKKRYNASDKVQQARIEELEKQISDLESKKKNIESQNIEQINKLSKDIEKANNTMGLHQKNMRHKQDILHDLMNKKDEIKNFKNVLTNKIKSLGGDINDTRKAFKQYEGGLICGAEIMGTLEYNYRKQKISKIALSVDGEIGFKIDGRFFLGYIPMFYTMKIKAGLHVELDIYETRKGLVDPLEIGKYILVGIDIGFAGELGAGINHFANIRFFAEAKYGISGYCLMPEFYTEKWKEFLGSEFDMKVGVRATIFMFPDFEIGYGHYFQNDAKLPDFILNAYSKKQNKHAQIAKYIETNNFLSSNIYDGSKPQIEKVGNNYVASWIDMELNGEEPRTVLKYSIYGNGNWSAPKAVYSGGSDFYHDMYFDGRDLHITWQKVKEGCDISSLEEMCKNSEVYYTKFDGATAEFSDIRQISDNDVLDLGPKFVLQENSDQPLTIAWQRNSADDIIGLTGRNSVVYSTVDGGGWSASSTLCESDRYISFVDTAYVNGKLTCAFVEDADNDLTTDDRKIVVCVENAQRRIIGEGFEVINNPQFFRLDGETKLTFYADGNIRYTNDLIAINKFDIADGKINDTYKITENEMNIYVYYYKVGKDNSAQTYASIYDKHTGDWQTDVCLTSAKNKVTCPSIAILPNGNILTVYNSLDKETEIVSLEYEIKQLKKDFEIEYAFYDLDVSCGDNFDLFMIIKNTGDYPIKSVEVSAFGKTDTLVLENTIEVGESDTISVKRIFNINTEGKEKISVRFGDIVRNYLLTTRFTDISIEGSRRIDTYREYYDLILKNSSEEGSEIYLDIYYNGVLVETVNMYLEGEKELNYTYYNDEFVNGGYVFFEIRTEIEDKYSSDNGISFCVEYMAEKEIAKTNPYFESMQVAKSL